MGNRPSVRQSAFLIGACTLLSRILGMARDILGSHFFGAGMLWDAFQIAWRIPNLFRRLFGEGALTAAFIPSFVRLVESDRRAEAFALLNRLLTMLVLFLGIVTALGIGLTYVLPRIWPDEKMQVTMDLVRILLPYIPLVCAGAILGAALNGLFRFFAPAFAPVVLNITWILAIPFLVLQFPADRSIRYLAMAGVAGGVLQLLSMAIPLKREGARFRFDWAPRDEGLREIGRLFLPTTFGLALVQINEVVDQVIAEVFVPGHGAVSALYFANLFTQFPLSLVGTSIATAILPGLASAAARNEPAEFGSLFRRGLSGALYLGIPASVGLVLFGPDIISVVFEHGAFTPEATWRAGLCATMFGLGLWCYCANQVQVRAFHATKDTRTPVRVSAAMVGLNLALNLVLVFPMREAGLALATSITGFVSFLTLNRILRKRHPEMNLMPPGSDFIKSLGAAAGMAAAGGGVAALLRSADTSTLASRAALLGAAVTVGVLVYFGLTRLMGMAEALTLLRRRR